MIDKMRKIIVNKKGMTLIEVLVAIALIAILTFVFVPFINSSFRWIILAGQMHKDLASSKSVVDEAIAKEDFFVASSYPIYFDSGEDFDVDGTLISNNSLSTFLAFDALINFESGLIQEGYAGQHGTYAGDIGSYPGSDPLYVRIIGQSTHLSKPGGFISSQIISFKDKDGNDVNVYQPNFDYDFNVIDSDHADIIIESGQYGLDNAHSPYGITIETRYGFFFLWRKETINLGIKISLPTYMALGTHGVEEMSSNHEDWLAKSGRLPNQTFNGIAWGNDSFVAVGNGGKIYYHKNQENWTQASVAISDNLQFIRYINGIFIVGGTNGRLLTSANGVDWTIRTTGITETITGIAYSSDTYIATCDDSINTDGQIADFIISSDLITWNLIDDPDSSFKDATDIVYDGYKFMAVGADGVVLYSTDLGVSWANSIIDTYALRRVDLNSITFSHSKHMGVIVGDDGLIYTYDITQTSVTPSTFTRRDNSPQVSRADFNEVAYSNNIFITVGDNEALKYSLDGITWNAASSVSEMGNCDIQCIVGRN